MKDLPLREEKSENSTGAWRLLFALVFVFLVLSFLFINVLYQETLGKQNLVVQVQSFQFGALFTDKGTFNFYQPTATRWDRRLKAWFGIEPVSFLFWRDRARVLRAQLRLGCHYEIAVVNSLFDDHEIGISRMPPQTTVVKVRSRIETTEHECDLSALSGKPVCRWDQVEAIEGKGISMPLKPVCDFETFLNIRNTLSGRPSWYR